MHPSAAEAPRENWKSVEIRLDAVSEESTVQHDRHGCEIEWNVLRWGDEPDPAHHEHETPLDSVIDDIDECEHCETGDQQNTDDSSRIPEL